MTQPQENMPARAESGSPPPDVTPSIAVETRVTEKTDGTKKSARRIVTQPLDPNDLKFLHYIDELRLSGQATEAASVFVNHHSRVRSPELRRSMGVEIYEALLKKGLYEEVAQFLLTCPVLEPGMVQGASTHLVAIHLTTGQYDRAWHFLQSLNGLMKYPAQLAYKIVQVIIEEGNAYYRSVAEEVLQAHPEWIDDYHQRFYQPGDSKYWQSRLTQAFGKKSTRNTRLAKEVPPPRSLSMQYALIQ